MKNFSHHGNSIIAFRTCLVVFVLFSITQSLSAQTIYYVKPGATGNGSSWSNAGSLQSIINLASAGSSQVWVAGGTYVPSAYPPGSSVGPSPSPPLTSRDFAFGLKLGVAVYGGFAGTETALAQRDPLANPTILSGEIGTSAVSDNCYHVVMSYGGSTGAPVVTILDGFTIQGGNANGVGAGYITYDGVSVTRSFGGGIICGYSNQIITNCIITGNMASNGGGICSVQGAINVSHTQINFNVSDAWGGGMYFSGGSISRVSSCQITNNTAAEGGGIYNNGATGIFSGDDISHNTANSTGSGMGGGGVCNASGHPTMIACIFTGNQTSTGADGGAIYIDNLSSTVDSGCVFSGNTTAWGDGGAICNNGGIFQSWNCLFTGNGSHRSGGAIYMAAGSKATITNSSIVDNMAALNSVDPSSGTGGGIYAASGIASSNPIMYNNIIWGNSSGLVVVGGSPTVEYNDIQGSLHPGVGNISADPKFVNESNPIGIDGVWGTADDGLQLVNGPTAASASPAMNTGTSGVGTSISYDMMYVARPVGAGIDMGSYEAPMPTTLGIMSLMSFTATASGPRTTLLQWRTDAQQQASAYEVQRSSNGLDFAGIATLNTERDATDYSFVDANAGSGNIFYRLKWNQGNNNPEYSGEVVVRHSSAPGDMSLRPSVVEGGSAVLVFEATSKTDIAISISDISGRLYRHQTLSVNQGENELPLDLSSFPGGVYYLNVQGTNGFHRVLQFVKL